jgi:hypothetical protein
MAVENLQGELQRVTKTLDLQESLVNGWVGEFWFPLPIYLFAKLLNYSADYCSADSAQDHNRSVSLGNDSVGHAQKHADDQTRGPSRPRQAHGAQNKTYTEPVEEGAKKSSSLIGKRKRNH